MNEKVLETSGRAFGEKVRKRTQNSDWGEMPRVLVRSLRNEQGFLNAGAFLNAVLLE